MNSAFPTVVYLLCFLTSMTCAGMLMRSYGRTGLRLLLWSGLCFVLLAANNLMVIVDILILPDQDLQTLRHSLSLAGLTVLLYGFIWDLER